MRMLIGMVSCVAMVVMLICPAQAVVLFEDDFETNNVGDNPAGWTLDEYRGTVDVTNNPVHGGTKSVVIDSQGEHVGDWLAMSHNFTQVTNQILVAESWVLAGQGDQSIYAFDIRDSSDNSFTKILMRYNGYFAYNENGSWHNTTKAYVSNTWYHIKFEIDMDNTNWDYYVDDALLASNINWSDASATYPSIVCSPGMANADSGFHYIDDVEVGLIPEPSSIVFLLGGGLALLVVARRKNSAK